MRLVLILVVLIVGIVGSVLKGFLPFFFILAYNGVYVKKKISIINRLKRLFEIFYCATEKTEILVGNYKQQL